MTPSKLALMVVCSALCSSPTFLISQELNSTFARDPGQPVDQQYTDQIRKYTTDPSFISPLVDYLPSSKTVPTPAKVLGDVSGAPDMLPYAEDVYKYFRLLEASSPRVKVFTIGHSEEGREMIAAAIADPKLLAGAKENDARLAQLADPRTIGFDDTKVRQILDQSWPVYYITGTIHSPETGAPTALMELAYRLAVDDAPYIKYIRSHMIVLITPVVEVDGRDRMVDIYRWHKAHPGQDWPRLLYWGHYVAHDNNRDAMAMTLNLTRNVLDTYLGWHAQVLHDLHESVPFLYDNTVGDGPYNAWVDPILGDEWAELGWNNVAQMQSFGMPGVFTHGDFDTWSPGYLMFLASMHNGISRLYETFGNGGADTEKRILDPEEYSRTWYRQNPALPVVIWSQRDNNNYEETALLTTISYFSHNTRHFLENYYLKSKRAVEKPSREGPAAYVIPPDSADTNRQVELLKVLQRQHVEIKQLSDEVTANVPGEKRGDKAKQQTFPAGSIVVRMDQPYSRAADALLDRQFWAPSDPQKHPYDDTGWSFTHLFNLKVARIVDPSILQSKMTPVDDPSKLAGKVSGSGSVLAVNNSGQISLLSLAYKLKGATIQVAEKPFDSDGQHFAAGSLLITAAPDNAAGVLRDLSLDASRLGAAPSVPVHTVAAPRIAFMHTWLNTQTEGWWRYAFDTAGVPYDYINTQTAASQPDLRAKYDVIIFAPVGYSSTAEILSGIPAWNNAMPWQKSELTPNLGALDSTADIRPGLGYDGLAHLKQFVEQGGLLITCEDTAQFAIDTGLAPGVSVAPHDDARVVGTVLNTVFVAPNNPIAFGYRAGVPVISANGMAFNVSNTVVRAGGRRAAPEAFKDPYEQRATGRGSIEDSDQPQGRKIAEAEPLLKQQPWEPKHLNEEETRNNPRVIPVQSRPDVILRFSGSKDLLLDGLLDKASSIAEHAIVVNAHLGQGNVLLFGNNPIYRGETLGTYALVFNAILNYQQLDYQHVPHEPAPADKDKEKDNKDKDKDKGDKDTR
ncbi:MAG TPA: M14 family zinc carboxypeptidase [Verrucomicrobiae bacterium]|nr:M14 family zinc carboxypeptidase [Verrucomicrobiae bacterium]